jgi:hypothetical protein
MKIGIMYSGLSSFKEEYFENHYTNIFLQYNPDIYISTYSSNDDSISKIDKKYQPKILHIEDFNTIEPLLQTINKKITYKRPETKSINILSMYYKLYRSFNLIPNIQDYDIIIRNRLDIKYDSNLNLIQNEFLNVPMGGDHHGGLLDLFAYGNPEIMQSYSDIFLYAPIYIIERHHIFHPEIFLRHHCQIKNLKIKRFQYNLFLRDELFNNPIYTYE